MATKRKPSKTSAELQACTDPRTPLDSARFLKAAAPVLAALGKDLLERADASPAVTLALKARHAAEREHKRTADDYAVWRRNFVGQVADAWLLSVVFVRTLEDRGLLATARIAGPGAEDSQRLFFELAPSLTARDYLLTVFKELSRFPAAAALFDARHNPVWKLGPSDEACKQLLQLFRLPSSDAPGFRFGEADTRFLGDLYQDLDEDVRKRFALLQTPRFVEAFILDRTLEPAIARFGLDDTTLIDPTCGSGHFLLGAFDRLYDHQLRAKPGLSEREAAHRALDALAGSDINPYAVAIARFRLTLAYLEKTGFSQLAQAPELPLHLTVADSLLHNPQLKVEGAGKVHEQKQMGFQHAEGQVAAAWAGEEFALEDEAAARDVLHRRYAAVVGNPPYITVKDAVLRDRYREMYPSAFREYSVAVPFTERFFQLARDGGGVGMITANSFMKREFGKKLIEAFLPSVNLTEIVNTSGAYIPGHGTPTVLLFGTAEAPQAPQVLCVLAKRGEPSTPDDPEQGFVWRATADHGRQVGYDDDYISVAEVQRAKLAKHPWSLAGGGADTLKALLEDRAAGVLGQQVDSIGFMCITKQDEVFAQPLGVFERHGAQADWLGAFVIGEFVRDWSISPGLTVFFPYTQGGDLRDLPLESGQHRFLWPFRRVLESRAVFGGKDFKQAGRAWYEYGQIPTDRIAGPAITFAFVATHNHFVLDRGGKVFNRSAPIIKLPEGATEEDHLALLAYLNSSTACFWMKQVCHNKTNASQKHSTDPARAAYEFAGTALEPLPIPPMKNRARLVALARELLAVSEARSHWLSGKAVREGGLTLVWQPEALNSFFAEGWKKYDALTARAAFLQEELDWLIYCEFGLLEPAEAAVGTSSVAPEGSAPLGGRPFEHERGYDAGVSERVQGGRTASSSVARPEHWNARIALLARPGIRLLEDRAYKRMWRDTERNVDQREFRDEVTRKWMRDFATGEAEQLVRARAAPVAARHVVAESKHYVQGAAECLGEEPVHFAQGLLDAEAVPYLAAHRYAAAGLEKHRAWQHTWELQRREDAGEAVGDIPVPPKYDQKDFRDSSSWSLRGKLDVPKERFISYPGCESDEDGEPVYGWAGWNPLQRAQALAELYQHRKTDEGWDKPRLTPMLAGLHELIPWVKQWHNGPDSNFGGLRLGDYFADFLAAECQTHGLTEQDLLDWRPPERKGRGKKRKDDDG